jgi:hypothetical protein
MVNFIEMWMTFFTGTHLIASSTQCLAQQFPTGKQISPNGFTSQKKHARNHLIRARYDIK